MIIKFKCRQYYEIRDKYEMLFKYAEPKSTDEKDGNALVVNGYRIVIPQLHVSFREANWYTRNKDIEDPEDDKAWDVQDSVYVLYEEEVKDINKYDSFMTGFFEESIDDACRIAGYPSKKKGSLECYIDTSEFVDEKIVRELYPKNWKKQIIAKYPEFFDAIKGYPYKLDKIRYYDAGVEIYNDRSYISVYLGKTYWFSYCEWFGRNTSRDPDQDAAYHEIIDFVKSVISNEKFGVICFADGKRAGTALYNMEELPECTREKVLKDFQVAYPAVRGKNHEITLKWCFWEGPENYKEIFNI